MHGAPEIAHPSGMFVAIVGPSGAGKDTILSGLRLRLPQGSFLFPRRIITRQPDATEESLYLSEQAFQSSKLAGEFLIAWEAHGLHYAIPRQVLHNLEAGQHVIANISREAVPGLRSQLRRVLVVHITARPDILEERLRRRGREFGDDQRDRLHRGLRLDAALEADIRIENNGSAEEAIISLMNVLVLLPVPRNRENPAA